MVSVSIQSWTERQNAMVNHVLWLYFDQPLIGWEREPEGIQGEVHVDGNAICFTTVSLKPNYPKIPSANYRVVVLDEEVYVHHLAKNGQSTVYVFTDDQNLINSDIRFLAGSSDIRYVDNAVLSQ